MTFPDARLLVFAKAPRPGAVLTRLQGRLGAERAARLHADLVRHALGVACGGELCPVELWCAPATAHPFFDQCARDFGVVLRSQRGDDLGERMYYALAAALQQSAYAMVMGCDCPSLTASLLRRGLEGLDRGEDAVIAAAEDGGYVLLGVRRAELELFRDIPWGTAEVAAITRRRLRHLGWHWQELPVQWDVDRPQDLRRLASTGFWRSNRPP